MSLNKLNNFKKNLTAIILCGGKGKRLKPITNNIPKPLVQIKKKEILIYIINKLLNYKVKNIILASGYKHKVLKKFYETKLKNIKSLQIINTGENSDIITRIKKCSKISNNLIMVCYGDTLVDINLNKYFNFFLKNKKFITFSVYNLKSQFGLLKLKKNFTPSFFREKPNLDYYFNIGFFIFDKKNIKILEKYNKFKNFLEDKKILSKFKCFVHKGKHITVNTIEELNLANKNIQQFK